MMYQKNIADGYIVSIVSGVENGNISVEEYNNLKSLIDSQPQAPRGYYYRLKEDLSWELCEFVVPEDALTDNNG